MKVSKGLLFVVYTFLVLSGCSFTKITGSLKGKESQQHSLIALLPSQIEGEIARERVQLLHRLVRSELQSRGFTLIDEQVIQKFCADSKCAGRGDLVLQHGVQAFVEHRIVSVARANFFAGFVNSIIGKVTFRAPSGEELIAVMHSERERGGLLFNSGQLAQAVIQTAGNAKTDESFSLLAGLYAKDIVEKVPPPAKRSLEGTGMAGDAGARIDMTTVTVDPSGADKVCVSGTMGSLGFLVYRRAKTSLRETAPGSYCGVFRLNDFPKNAKIEVELRTAYGDVVRDQLKIPASDQCEIANAVRLTDDGKRINLQVTCDSDGADRYIVYRSFGDVGAFEKIGEFKGKSWNTAKSQGAKYAIVKVLQRGEFTSPIVLTAESSHKQS